MRKIQNFSLDQSVCSNQSPMASSAPQTPNQQSNQKKSIPKFNRKTSANLITRKSSQLNFQHQSPLCFISPKKALTIHDNFFKSPNFKQASEKFASTFNEKTLKDTKENCQSQIQQAKSHKKIKKISKKDFQLIADLVNDEKQKESLLYQIVQLKKQNNNMSKKLKELEGVREYLMERQNYIYEISQINMGQLEQIAQINKNSVQLNNKIQNLEKQIESEHLKSRKMEQQHQSQLSNEKQTVQSLQKLTLKLKDQIKLLKQENLKQNVFTKRSKQNIISTNLKRQRNPLKSKSAFYTEMIDITNNELLNIDETKSVQDDNKQNETSGILNGLQCTSQLNDSDSFLAFKLEHSELFRDSESQYTQNVNTNVQNQQQNLIKKLKQKIRYCQIQIDVLKKIKVDSLKIKDENQKIKALNRKYLTRIQYFTKRYSRRSGSDSSLELSLTPKKKLDLN